MPTRCDDLEQRRDARLAICARVERHGLIAAECAALTGGRPDVDGVAACHSVERIGRAAFVRLGLDVCARASTVEELAASLASGSPPIASDRFRIDVHDPRGVAGRSRSEVAARLAAEMVGDPDLDDPLHRFVAVARDDGIVLGEVVAETDAGFRRHDDKPWTTSSSLDSRFARGLVNLVPEAATIVDPCCGAGSIVVEAASLGLAATGVDWKPAMAGMTRENLAYFGYAGEVLLADSRMLEVTADAVVTDLPYGRAIDGDEATIRELLHRAGALAPVGVFVAPADITTWLTAAGYTDVEVHTVRKRRGFTRWIHRARSTAAG